MIAFAAAALVAGGCTSPSKSSSAARSSTTTSTTKKQKVTGEASQIVGSVDALIGESGSTAATIGPGGATGGPGGTGPAPPGVTRTTGGPGSAGASTSAGSLCSGPGQPAAPTPPTTTPDGAVLAANPDLVLSSKGLAVVAAVLANDVHPPTHVLFVASPSTPAHGKVDVVAGGRLVRYQPDANFTGEDSFTYDAVDGPTRSTARVTVRVQGAQPSPLVSPVVVQPETCTTVLAPAHVGGPVFVISGVTPAAHGALVVDPEGARIDYSPAAGFHGNDGCTITLSDGGPNPTYFALAIKVP